MTEIPGPRGVGVIPALLRDPFGFCMAAAADGDGLVRIKAGPVSAYLVSDPGLVRHVLVDNAGNYVKGSMMDGIRVALGNGLFTADGPAWRRQRRLMQPAFQADRLGRTNEVLEAVVAEAACRWAAGGEFDLFAETARVNTEVVLRSLFGMSLPADRHQEIIRLIDEVFAGMARRMWAFFLPPWLPAPGRTGYRRAVAALDEIVLELIADRRGAVGTGADDLLELLLQARDTDGDTLTDRQLRDEIFTMFLAGNDSTAVSLTWTLALVAGHPEVAARLRAEVDEVAAGRLPAVADLPRLGYTRDVVFEGFRLYPAFPMYFRTSVAADQVGPYQLPAGAYVVISPYATHRDPRSWPEPAVFDPGRFEPGRFGPAARAAYYPFGVGKRRCIGEPLSLTIAQLVLATLAGTSEWTVTGGELPIGRYAMTYQPKGGLPAVLTGRR